MPLQWTGSDRDTDKSPLLGNAQDRIAAADRQQTSPLGVRPEQKNADDSDKSLRTPSRPDRILSPDAFSHTSLDEQVRPREPLGPPDYDGLDEDPDGETPTPLAGWRVTLQESWTRNKGLAYMLMAQVFGVLMNVTTRVLEIEGNKGKGMHPFQILFARMGITVILSSVWMWYNKTPHFPLGKPEVRWLLACRGFGGFFGVFGMYYSLRYLPLADCTVLTFLAPGLVCWVCSFLLKEPFTRKEQIATIVSFSGVVLIARPTSFFSNSGDTPPASGDGDMEPGFNRTTPGMSPSDASNYDDVTPEQRLKAVGIAMIGVCGTVVAFTTIRWIGKRAHPLISVNYFAAWCTFVSFVMQFALPGVGFLLPADLKEWGYLVFLANIHRLQQFLLAAGLSYEKSSRATNMTYTQMLFALTFDKLMFGHSPGWMSIFGSSLILGPAIFIALQKNIDESKEASEGSRMVRDEEAQRGLLGAADAGDRVDDEGRRMPVPEVQMRALR
ncbi:hypothetical protein Q7P37_009052 [Cladosporium fusiforme]